MSDERSQPESESRERRGQSPYTTREKVLRLLWWYLGQPLMRCSFHNWYGFRAWLLRRFGASIGRSTRIRPSVRVEQPWNLTIGDNTSVGDRAQLYCLGIVRLGDHVSISQNAHICAGTHDHESPRLPLMRPPITIEDDVWIAADAYVGPNVTIGKGAVLGARACAYKDLEAGKLYGGNPCRELGERGGSWKNDSKDERGQ
ncbi:MAG: hypothetical protein ACF8GE_03965 [Phycisphaerales bacterium JB043]